MQLQLSLILNLKLLFPGEKARTLQEHAGSRTRFYKENPFYFKSQFQEVTEPTEMFCQLGERL